MTHAAHTQIKRNKGLKIANQMGSSFADKTVFLLLLLLLLIPFYFRCVQVYNWYGR